MIGCYTQREWSRVLVHRRGNCWENEPDGIQTALFAAVTGAG